MNQTYSQRMQQQDARIWFANSILDAPLNRKQERRLARSKQRITLSAAPKAKKQRAKAKKDGTVDILERRVSFFGPDYVFGSRTNALRLPQGLHYLNREETKRLVTLRKKSGP